MDLVNFGSAGGAVEDILSSGLGASSFFFEKLEITFLVIFFAVAIGKLYLMQPEIKRVNPHPL